MTPGFSLQTVTTVEALRIIVAGWREKGETVALVPTMGALHKGHLALLDAAQKSATRSIVSIFVNPLQFGPQEDLAAYPRPFEVDQKLLSSQGCDLLYAPTADEMYPEGYASSIDPGPLGSVLEGASRPGHFHGVATVVAKLLNQADPDIAFFGEKDYQQLLVIRRMVLDLDLPVSIRSIKTVREEDGLALSSRNVYLSSDERERAALLPRTLGETAASILKGQPIRQALAAAAEALKTAGFAVDYLTLADAATLEPVLDLGLPARLLVAARLRKVRLIDNWPVEAQH